MLQHVSNFLIALLVFGLCAKAVVFWIDQGTSMPPIAFYISIGLAGLVTKLFTVLEHYMDKQRP